MTRRGWLLFAAMGIIWGIPYLLIKVAVGELTPAALVFFRTAVGASLLLPAAAMRGDLGPLRAKWRPLVLYSLVEVAVPWFLLADAERHLSSSFTGLIIATVPLVGAVLAWGTRAEYRVDGRRLAGLVIGFVGVAALLGLNVTVRDFGAVGEVVLVSVCYAVGPVIIAPVVSGARSRRCGRQPGPHRPPLRAPGPGAKCHVTCHPRQSWDPSSRSERSARRWRSSSSSR
jgi:drug/metabolite transporter (DMT)-like permease